MGTPAGVLPHDAVASATLALWMLTMLDITMFFSLAILAAAGLGLLPELLITSWFTLVDPLSKRDPN